MTIIDTILAKSDLNSFQLSIAQALALNRKRLKLSRKQLSHQSGVSYGSLRRFEETGQISLQGLLKLARRLDSLNAFEGIFKENEFSSLDELRRSK